jgi:hypothetical protein
MCTDIFLNFLFILTYSFTNQNIYLHHNLDT